MLALAACGGVTFDSGEEPPKFRGGVAGDEPRAVAIAKEILERGGSAADAAVALYFTLAVVKPSAASLGAYGVCLAYDPVQKKVQTIDFTVDPSSAPGAAPPAAVRGMYALHGAFGSLRWEQLVAPAEQMARFGVGIIPGLAADLAAGGAAYDDASVAATFGRADETRRGEGELLKQPDLAVTLSALRVDGPGALYGGSVGRRFADGMRQIGQAMSADEIYRFTPKVADTIVTRSGSTRIHFTYSPRTAGYYEALLYGALSGDFADARPGERVPILAAAARAAYGEAQSGAISSGESVDKIARSLAKGGGKSGAAPYDPVVADRAGTGFAVADARGMGVACGVTMGRPFGIGRMAAGTGIFPAARPAPGEIAPSLSPIIAMNPNTNVLFLAAAGSGVGAPTALAQLASRTIEEKAPVAQAMNALRVEPVTPGGGGFLAEPEAARDLLEKGIGSRTMSGVARLNAVSCPNGLPRSPNSCAAATDPRGAGATAQVGP